MLKKVVGILLASAASVFSLVATSGVGPASLWFLYEPEVPEHLKKEL